MKVNFYKNFIYVLIFIYVSSCSPNSNEYKSNWAEYWLSINGKVKSVNHYRINDKDSIVGFSSYKFDRFGRFIERKFNRDRHRIHRVLKYNHNEKLAKIPYRVSMLSEFSEFENGSLNFKENWIDSLDINKNLVKQSKYLDNLLVRTTRLIYTSKGNLSSCKTFDFKNETITVESYIFNDNNVLLKETFIRYNKDSIQERKIIRTYNSNGNEISSITYNEENDFENIETYKYNSSEKLVYYKDSDSVFYNDSRISYTREGIKIDSIYQYFWSPNPETNKISAYKTEIYKFNKQEKLKERIIKKNDSILNTTSYIYNEKGILIEERIEYVKGYTKVKYNNYEHEILRQSFDNNDLLESEKKNHIEYDDYNNVVLMKTHENDTLKKVIKREYEYYE